MSCSQPLIFHFALITSFRPCAACWHSRSLFLNVSYYRLSGQKGGCHAGCVLQCASGYLSRIKDTGLLPCLHTLPCTHQSQNLGRLFYLVNDNRALKTCVCGDMEQRSFQSFQDNLPPVFSSPSRAVYYRLDLLDVHMQNRRLR